MKSFKLITVLAFFLCTTFAFAQWRNKKIKGNGDITTITRLTGTYEGIKAAGPMDFKLVPGKEGKVSIKGDSNLMNYIVTKIKDNKLIIKVKNETYIKSTETITVTVPYESISYVSLAGSGDLVNKGTLKTNDFKASLVGSGNISLKIDSNVLKINIAGSGDIELSGANKDLTLKISGSGDFNGKKLNSKNVEVKIAGSGTADVVCNGKLKVRIFGSGNVNYFGKPTNKDTKISGSGSVSN